jgi:hypothetical protein
LPVGIGKALIGIFRVWLALGRAIIQTRFDGVSPDFGKALPQLLMGGHQLFGIARKARRHIGGIGR